MLSHLTFRQAAAVYIVGAMVLTYIVSILGAPDDVVGLEIGLYAGGSSILLQRLKRSRRSDGSSGPHT